MTFSQTDSFLMKFRDFKVLIRTFTLLGLDTAIPSTTVEVVVEEEVVISSS